MAKKIQDRPNTNLVDYVYNFGMIPFLETPFTLNDGLVFSAIAYLPFEETDVKVGDSLKEFCVKLLGTINYKIKLKEYQIDRTALCLALLNAPRFTNFKIVNIKNVFSDEKKIQYASIAFKNDDNLIITYRGTDNTITGWQEDFYMSCYDTLFSHEIALDFLTDSIKNYTAKRIYVTGHSKGGNLALYSSSMIEEKYQKKITNVLSFDGPGLLDDVYNSEGHKRIKLRIVHIVPPDCLIGVLLNHEEITHIVKAYPENDMFNQHDLFRLETNGSSIVDVKDRTPLSYYMEESFDEFLNKSLGKKEDRIRFFTALFDVIAEMGIKDANYIFENPYVFMRKFFFFDKKKYDDSLKFGKTLKTFMSIFSRNLMTYRRENKIYQKKQTELK